MPLGRARPSGMRSTIALAFALLCAVAHAENCTQYRLEGTGSLGATQTGWESDVSAACAQAQTEILRQADVQNYPPNRAVAINSCTTTGGGSFTLTYQNPGFPPGTTNFTWGVVPRTGDFCTPDVCASEANKTMETNFTVAWGKSVWPVEDPGANSSNQVGDFTPPTVGSIACVPSGSGFCSRTVGAPIQVYTSLQPSVNGLYRLSVKYSTTGTGASCTPKASDASANPATADRPCPGTKGEVNGNTVCLPSGGSAPPSNPASGPPAGVPGTTGNPAAGDKPSAGPGSGQGGAGETPVSGNGGNAGGGSSASGGKGVQPGTPGAGTAGDPYRAKDPCGIPGGPACKIDESGTGSGSGAYDSAKSALDATKQGSLDQLTQAQAATGKDTTWGFSFNLPSGCTVIPLQDLEGFSFDVCRWQPIIHDLMSMVWVGAAIWCCIGMVGRTLQGGA